MGYIIFSLLTAVVGFLLGVRYGRKRANNAEALAQAWKKGYDSASAFWQSELGRLSASKSPAGPPEVKPPPADIPEAEQKPATPRPSGYSPHTPSSAPAAQIPSSEPAAHPLIAPGVVRPSGAPAAPGLPFMRNPETHNAPTAGQAQPYVSAIARKSKPVLSARARELRNINVTLYVAALLLVAAGALFLSFALPPVAKLVGLCLVAGGFYTAGLLIYRVKPTLQPAAAAFAGTGLALLPLCAIATYNTLEISATTIWLIFSILGTAAFGYATLKVRSRILAWLAVLILISTAMSSGAVIQQGVFAYLVALLALSVLMQLLIVRSRAVRGSLFFAAMDTSIRLIPLLVFFATLVMIYELGPRKLFWTFLLLSAHYLLTTVLQSRFRALNFAAARLLGMLGVVAGMAYLEFKLEPVLIVVIVLLVFQAVMLTHAVERYQQVFDVPHGWSLVEKIILWASAVLFTASLYPVIQEQLADTWWVTLLVIPALLGILIWFSQRRGYLEPLVLLALAGLTFLETTHIWWRPLPALVLAVIGLSLVARRPIETVARAATQLRWLVLLLIGAKLAQCLHVFTGGAPYLLLLPSLVGLWAVTVAMLARNIPVLRKPLRPGLARDHFLGRVLASCILLLAIAGVARTESTHLYRTETFLSLGFTPWSVLLLVGAVVVLIAMGLVHERHTVAAADSFLRLSILGSLVVLFALGLRGDLWWLAVLVAAANLFYLGTSLRTMVQPTWKIAYAALAQIHFTAAIWWTVAHFELDHHGQLAVLLLSLLLPQAARLLRLIRQAKPVSNEMQVISLGVLVVVPFILGVYALDWARADRGTVLLGMCAWMGYAIVAHRAFANKTYRQWLGLPLVFGSIALAVVPAAIMNSNTGWIRNPLWGETTVLWLLVVLVVAAASLEYLHRERTSHARLRLVAMAAPWLMLLSYQETLGWRAFAFALAALCGALMVHTRQLAWVAVPTAGLVLSASYTGWRAVAGEVSVVASRTMDVSWAMLFGALVLLVLALLHGRFGDPLPSYELSFESTELAPRQASRFYYAAMLAAGLIAGVNAHLLHQGYLEVLGGAVLILLALLLVRVHELPAAWAQHGTDGLLLCAGLLALRGYYVLVQELTSSATLLYLGALTAAIALRHLRARSAIASNWLIAAAVLVSAAELASVFDGGSVVQMLVLIFFAGLLTLGLLRGEKLFIWWSAIAITAAVVWFLRHYAFLLLTLLAIGLIVLAVLKLMKVEKTPK